MSTLEAALLVLIAHGALGAFDTIYCHEWQAVLPRQSWAGRELRLHAMRSMLYVVIFLGLAWFEWRGVYAWLLIAILAAEYAVTLADAVVEDRTRRLSRAERLVHMILGGTTGAYMALAIYHAVVEWLPAPNALAATGHGIASVILSVFAFGVLISSLRDAEAAKRMQVLEAKNAG